MRQSFALIATLAVSLMLAAPAFAACPAGVNPTASTALHSASASDHCRVHTRRGYSLPDPRCTPGAYNPSVTLAVLRGGAFKTPCVRDVATSPTEKATTYQSYGITHPNNNTGSHQTCELDHLISLELGGADTLANIWPQCGPSRVVLRNRYFKIKDLVENYLAEQVQTGAIGLRSAQRGIASDWTQYIASANTYYASHRRRRHESDQ